MATLSYELSEDRARRLTEELTAAGYHAGIPRQRSASSTQQVMISDVDDDSREAVDALVKRLDASANPIAT